MPEPGCAASRRRARGAGRSPGVCAARIRWFPCATGRRQGWGLTGAVYGTLLNHRSALTELGSKAAQPPYDALPRAPVLYIKPRNTLAASGDAVEIPAGVNELEVGPCLGLVIGRTACRVPEEGA